MTRLPQPGSDDGTWGDILNEYLLQAHNSDGSLKTDAVGSSVIADGSISESKLDTATQTKLNGIAPVTSVNSRTGDVIITKSDVGLSSVDNTADLNKPVSTAQQAALDIKANQTTTITGTTSLTGGGDLSTNRTISLVNDTATPGNSQYYGTDGTGTKGFYSLPLSGVQSVVAGTGITVNSADPQNPVVSVTSGGGPSYLGTNTIGGSYENMTLGRQYAKKITAPASGGILHSVQAYLNQSASAAFTLKGLVWADVAGTPGILLAGVFVTDVVISSAGWRAFPLGIELTASTDYWIGLVVSAVTIGSGSMALAYTTSGTDRYQQSGTVSQIGDWNPAFSPVTTTNDYSIRALVA